MKHILFYESRPEWGGAQKCELELLLSLEQEMMKTYFITSTEGPMLDRIRAAGESPIILPIHPSVNQIRKGQVKTGTLFLLMQLFLLLPHFFKVGLFILKNRIDLVYTSQFRSQLIIGWLAKLLGRSVIWHLHGEEQLDNLLGKVSVTCANRIVVVSHSLAERYKQQFPKQASKFVVVVNGVEVTRLERSKPNSIFTISMVGSLIEGKRQDLAISAVAQLIDKGLKVQLNILGEKPPWHSDEYKQTLHELVNRLDVSNSVTFLGWIEAPWKSLVQSDVFILPSDTEGMPLSIIEAMALGLPCIATEVGGIPELIDDGKTGFLIQPGSTAELVDRLNILIAHPEHCHEMGLAAKKRYETYFTKDSFVKGVVGVIDTIK